MEAIPILQAIAIALVTGAASGLVSWGAMRVELKFLRRDVDWAHRRIDRLESSRHHLPCIDRPGPAVD